MQFTVLNEDKKMNERCTECNASRPKQLKNNYEELELKIEKLILKIEKQQRKNEEDNKSKFLMLLEVVNNHLNEDLVRGIINSIKKEIKLGIMHIDRNQINLMNHIEKKIDHLADNFDRNRVKTEPNKNLSSSDYTADSKQVVKEENILLVKSCPTILDQQVLEQNKSIESDKCDNKINSNQTSVKKEIFDLLQDGNVDEAVMIVFQKENTDVLKFLYKNLMISDIEKLKPHLQFMLIKRGLQLFKELNNKIILSCLCNLIMNIDTNELKQKYRSALILVFDELLELEICDQNNMKLIINMQRNHVMALMR